MDRLSDYDYALPDHLIAQHPAASRSGSRLMAVGPDGIVDHVFQALPSLLAPGDLLVVNDTRVIKARLPGRRDTGGRIEALIDRITATDEALVLLKASHLPKTGARLTFGAEAGSPAGSPAGSMTGSMSDTTADGPAGSAADPGLGATVLGREDDPGGRNLPRFRLRFDRPVLDLVEAVGLLPLPPYIRHAADASDGERYQTVYGAVPGAVAAPTAGLHFDDAVFEALARRGVELARVTLHVGAGTFLPVRSEDLGDHRMHAERYRISPDTAAAIQSTRERGGRVIAVGTTTLRALEASGGEAGEGETDLFIRPGFRFRVVDRLLTNFHLPRSTLLILVSAFAGIEPIRLAYAHAVADSYRFFSYGDAMLLDRAPAPDDGSAPRPDPEADPDAHGAPRC